MEHIVCSCSEGLFLNPLQKEICLISLSAWLRTFCITHVWPMAETRGKPTQQRSGLNTTGISETNPPPPRKDSTGPRVAQISENWLGLLNESHCISHEEDAATLSFPQNRQPGGRRVGVGVGAWQWGRCQRDSTQISLGKMLSLSHMASQDRMNGEGVHIASWHPRSMRPPCANILLSGMKCSEWFFLSSFSKLSTAEFQAGRFEIMHHLQHGVSQCLILC